MKKLRLLSVFLTLFTAIGFVSCDTEPVDPLLVGEDPTQNAPASFEVDFSNQTYQATTVQAAVVGTTVVITAVKSDGSTFVITVPGTTTGTYTNAQILYAPTLGAADAYYNIDEDGGLNGSVTLSSINTTTHKITGTFAFTGIYTGAGQPDIAFTNGIFTNIPYSGTIAPVEPAGDPLFTVKIDGVLYTADTYQATVGNGLTSVVGFRGTNGEYVGILIDGIAVGEYTEEAFFTYSPDGSEDGEYSNISFDPVNADLGYVQITEINTAAHTISGNFHFTGYLDGQPNKAFTEGTFENIPYTDAETTPTDDVFNATVDGTNYTYGGTDLVVSVIDPNQINMQAIADDHGLRIYLNDPTEGSYAFSTEIGAPARAFYTNAAGVEVEVNNGSVLVTSIDENWITGTFSYNVLDADGNVIHTITNGAFHVEYNW